MTSQLTIRRVGALPYPLPRRQILRRLGYEPATTRLSPEEEQRLDDQIAAAASLCRNTCARWMGVIPILEVDCNRGVTRLDIDGGWEIASSGVATMLRHSRGVWLGAVTIGSALPTAVAKLLQAGDGATALIYDAVGSECADAAMDALQNWCRQQLLPSRALLGRPRFSPGYGGWSLTDQRRIHRLLQMDEMGVALTSSCIMTPEKSVTAIAPVG